MELAERRVVIVGGGFAGCCLAVNLARRSKRALNITIIEARAKLGRGLAYSTLDPDHRLNAPAFAHSIIPEDAWHFTRWCLAEGLDQTDPEAMCPDGASYQRRSDFARYLEQTVLQHAQWSDSGSSITHVVGQAVGVRELSKGSRYEVTVSLGLVVIADMLVLATGNHIPGLPASLGVSIRQHPAMIENAFDQAKLKGVDRGGRVLVVGAGLTALDTLSTLLKQGHRGPIQVLSRHGLRPQSQGPMPPVLALAKTPEGLAKLPGTVVIERIMGPPPAFLADPTLPRRVSAWIRALRQQIAEAQDQGKTWHAPFDDLRDGLWQLWPQLPSIEKRRFLRLLRPWYDMHRYRTPPQTDETVRAAEARGQVVFRRARVLTMHANHAGSIEVDLRLPDEATIIREKFDAVVNCTGLDGAASLATNPMLASLLEAQLIRPDPCALGIDVNLQCCALSASGQTQDRLRVIGPPSFGAFGDPIGAPYIAAQIYRMLPGVMEMLEA